MTNGHLMQVSIVPSIAVKVYMYFHPTCFPQGSRRLEAREEQPTSTVQGVEDQITFVGRI